MRHGPEEALVFLPPVPHDVCLHVRSNPKKEGHESVVVSRALLVVRVDVINEGLNERRPVRSLPARAVA